MKNPFLTEPFIIPLNVHDIIFLCTVLHARRKKAIEDLEFAIEFYSESPAEADEETIEYLHSVIECCDKLLLKLSQ